MKIGLVCPMLSFVGGVQRHVRLLGEGLRQKGVEVVYFSPADQDSPDLPSPHVQLGKAVILPNFNGSWNDYSATTQSREELLALIRHHRLDILHFHGLIVPFAAWQLLEASPVLNVATLHSGWEKTSPVENVIPLFEFLLHNLKQKLHQTIAVSHTAMHCERYFADDKTVIIPNPIDVATYRQPQVRPAALATDVVNIVFVGRLDQRKGFLELLRAFKAIPQPERSQMKLHVIGAGPLEAVGKAYLTEAALDGQVYLHGRMAEATKIAFLQHADFCVAPSLSGESFGMVLTEAMAAGRPLICGNNAGYAETMREYPAQDLILDPTKPRVFAKAIQKLATDASLRQQLSTWATKQVMQYDVPVVVERHLRLYRELLATRPV